MIVLTTKSVYLIQESNCLQHRTVSKVVTSLTNEHILNLLRLPDGE